MRLLGVLLLGVIAGWLLRDAWQTPLPSANEPQATATVETTAAIDSPMVVVQDNNDIAAVMPSPGRSIEIATPDNFDQLVENCRTDRIAPPSAACSDAVIELAAQAESGDRGFQDTLEDWLTEYPADGQAGFALIEHALDRGEYRYLLDILARLEGYLPRSPTQHGVPETVRRLVARVLSSAEMQSDLNARAEWLNALVGLFPAEKAWRYALADTLSETGEYQRSMDMLAYLLYDPEFGERAGRLRGAVMERLELSSHEAVPLDRIGDQFMVAVTVNRQHSLRLLIDTGASISALTADALERIAPSGPIADIKLETANGSTRSQLYRLDAMAAGRQTIRNLDVVSLDNRFTVADGLLGMNYLSRFHFILDQHSNLLYLNPR